MDPRGRCISFGLVACAIDCVAFLSLSISAKQKLCSVNLMSSRSVFTLTLLFCNSGEESSGVVGI